MQSGSFKRPNDIKPKPKPRRRTICRSPIEPEKKPLERLSSDALERSSSNALERSSSDALERPNSDALERSNTYLKLDADAMMKDIGQYENREHAMRVRAESASSTDSTTSSPDLHKEHLYAMQNGEDHVYSVIPDPKPPVPPPRPSLWKTRSWHVTNRKDLFPGGHGMPKIIETDEDSPYVSAPKAHDLKLSEKTGRKVQSLKARMHSPVSPISPSADSMRPPFLRQGSRGDVLISQVVKSSKSKVAKHFDVSLHNCLHP